VSGGPTMRITNIELDDAELPTTIEVRMTWDVWDRLCRDHRALRSVARRGHTHHLDGSTEEWWTDRYPIEWAGAAAKFYEQATDTGLSRVVSDEIYRCLSLLCARFWTNGIDDVVTKDRRNDRVSADTS